MIKKNLKWVVLAAMGATASVVAYLSHYDSSPQKEDTAHPPISAPQYPTNTNDVPEVTSTPHIEKVKTYHVHRSF